MFINCFSTKNRQNVYLGEDERDELVEELELASLRFLLLFLSELPLDELVLLDLFIFILRLVFSTLEAISMGSLSTSIFWGATGA